MDFPDSLMGRGSEVDLSKIQQKFSSILVEGERIEKAYRVLRTPHLAVSSRMR